MCLFIRIKHQLLPACAKLSAAAFGPRSGILDASKTLEFNRNQAQKSPLEGRTFWEICPSSPQALTNRELSRRSLPNCVKPFQNFLTPINMCAENLRFAGDKTYSLPTRQELLAQFCKICLANALGFKGLTNSKRSRSYRILQFKMFKEKLQLALGFQQDFKSSCKGFPRQGSLIEPCSLQQTPRKIFTATVSTTWHVWCIRTFNIPELFIPQGSLA